MTKERVIRENEHITHTQISFFFLFVVHVSCFKSSDIVIACYVCWLLLVGLRFGIRTRTRTRRAHACMTVIILTEHTGESNRRNCMQHATNNSWLVLISSKALQ
jgi:hypothetical protein